MRPTDKTTGAVWRLLSAWSEEQRANDPLHRRVTQGELANLFGVSVSLVSNWKYRESEMQTDEMRRGSKATGIPFDELSNAVREDIDHILRHNEARRSQSRPPRGPVGGDG